MLHDEDKLMLEFKQGFTPDYAYSPDGQGVKRHPALIAIACNCIQTLRDIDAVVLQNVKVVGKNERRYFDTR